MAARAVGPKVKLELASEKPMLERLALVAASPPPNNLMSMSSDESTPAGPEAIFALDRWPFCCCACWACWAC